MVIIKLRSEPLPDGRIRERIFVGPDEDHLQLAGSLVLTVGEWQLLGAALLLGADKIAQVRKQQGFDFTDVKIITEHDHMVTV